MLAANPQWAQVLREEVEEVMQENSWDKAALGKMHKLDSFIHESLRWNGLGLRKYTPFLSLIPISNLTVLRCSRLNQDCNLGLCALERHGRAQGYDARCAHHEHPFRRHELRRRIQIPPVALLHTWRERGHC